MITIKENENTSCNGCSADDHTITCEIQLRRRLPEDSYSGLLETTGHLLQIGDKVKMNIEAIGEGELDGVETTITGKNYWRYMNQHPNEIYTVVAYDFSNDNEVSYVLSGYMSDNNWYSSDLILMPEPKTNFEALKNMTKEEMAALLGEMMKVPANLLLDWLDGDYAKEAKS